MLAGSRPAIIQELKKNVRIGIEGKRTDTLSRAMSSVGTRVDDC